MRRAMLPWLIAAATLAGGCSGPSRSTTTATIGPHQGRLVPLPDGLGFVEVATENRAGSARTLTPEVVAYFLGPDAQTPLTPAPTEVALQVYLDEAKEMKTVPLRSAPDADSPQTTRFAAVPPPGFAGTLRTGRVNATVAGHAVDLLF